MDFSLRCLVKITDPHRLKAVLLRDWIVFHLLGPDQLGLTVYCLPLKGVIFTAILVKAADDPQLRFFASQLDKFDQIIC